MRRKLFDLLSKWFFFRRIKKGDEKAMRALVKEVLPGWHIHKDPDRKKVSVPPQTTEVHGEESG